MKIRKPFQIVTILSITLLMSATALATNRSVVRRVLGTLPDGWGFSATASTKVSLHEDIEDPRAMAKSFLTVTPSYKISDRLQLSLGFGVSQELNRGTETDVVNLQVALAGSEFALNPHIRMTPKVTGLLPTNAKDRYDYTYRGGVTLASTFSSQVEPLGKVVFVHYTPSVSRLFHKYTRAFDSSPNLEYKLSQSLVFSTHITSELSFSFSGGFITARSYQNHIIEEFNLSQSIIYVFNGQISASIGHTNAASPFEYNGRDSNIKFYDHRTSTVLGSLTISL